MMLPEHLVQRIAHRIFRPDRFQPPFQDLLLLQALARRACAQGLLHDAADGLRRPHRRRREQRGGRCRAQLLTAVDSRTNPASTAGTAQHDLDLVSG